MRNHWVFHVSTFVGLSLAGAYAIALVLPPAGSTIIDWTTILVHVALGPLTPLFNNCAQGCAFAIGIGLCALGIFLAGVKSGSRLVAGLSIFAWVLYGTFYTLAERISGF